MRRVAGLFTLLILWATPVRTDDIVVFAAASLKTALDPIAADFAETSGHQVAVSYAGSSQLARQISLGAPVDVFLSANPAWMDVLEAEAHLAPGTRSDLLGNGLVLVTADATAGSVDLEDPSDLATRIGTGRLAMALVEAVPAGIYGKAALESLGLWVAVEAQVAQADNVRAALALVASGAASAGVVYATDAVAEPRVHVAATFPEGSHPPIVYPVAAMAGRNGPATRALLDHLRSPTARDVFETQGFIWLGD